MNEHNGSLAGITNLYRDLAMRQRHLPGDSIVIQAYLWREMGEGWEHLNRALSTERKALTKEGFEFAQASGRHGFYVLRRPEPKPEPEPEPEPEVVASIADTDKVDTELVKAIRDMSPADRKALAELIEGV